MRNYLYKLKNTETEELKYIEVPAPLETGIVIEGFGGKWEVIKEM